MDALIFTDDLMTCTALVSEDVGNMMALKDSVIDGTLLSTLKR